MGTGQNELETSYRVIDSVEECTRVSQSSIWIPEFPGRHFSMDGYQIIAVEEGRYM